jgi:tryptophan-rich sensory protein
METELERLARERRERSGGWSWRVFGLTLLCMVVGAISGELTRSEIPGWYAGLVKPSFNPPNWVFGPVWSALYLLMGFAAGRVWESARSRPEARPVLRTFFILLLVNALWSLLFFGLHRPDLALIDILGYLILLVIWIRQLWPQHRVYALLQIPHLLWVSFATVLNASIWWLNK